MAPVTTNKCTLIVIFASLMSRSAKEEHISCFLFDTRKGSFVDRRYDATAREKLNYKLMQIMEHSPNKVLAVGAKGGLLEEARNKAMVLHVVDVLLLQRALPAAVPQQQLVVGQFLHFLLGHCRRCLVVSFYGSRQVTLCPFPGIILLLQILLLLLFNTLLFCYNSPVRIYKDFRLLYSLCGWELLLQQGFFCLEVADIVD